MSLPSAGTTPPPGTGASVPEAGSTPDLSPDRLQSLNQALSGLFQAVARPAEQANLFRELARAAGEVGRGSAIVATDEDEGVLRLRIGTGALVRYEGDLVPREGSLEGLAASAGEPQRSDSLRADPRAYRALERDLPAGPALAVPLSAEGGTVGAILLVRDPWNPPFNDEDVRAAAAFAASAAAAILCAYAFERTRGARGALDAWRAARAAESASARRLLRAVRHEVSNPLAAVLGHAQILASGEAVRRSPELQESVDAIHLEAERVDRIVRQLAALEESGAGPLLDEEGRLRLPPGSP